MLRPLQRLAAAAQSGPGLQLDICALRGEPSQPAQLKSPAAAGAPAAAPGDFPARASPPEPPPVPVACRTGAVHTFTWSDVLFHVYGGIHDGFSEPVAGA